MALETGTFKRSATVFPLATGTGKSLLQDADRGVFEALAYFAFVLDRYMGARLVAEAAACNAPIASAVAYQLPDEPGPYLTEEQVKFPLLSIQRLTDKVEDRTVTRRHNVSQWRVSYVLPPLTAGQREVIKPILHAVPAIIDDRIEAGGDPAYQGGAVVFGSSALLEKTIMTAVEYAEWTDGGQLSFPSVVMTLEVSELALEVVGAYDALNGTDTHLNLAQPPAATLTDVVVVSTNT